MNEVQNRKPLSDMQDSIDFQSIRWLKLALNI